jgi:hypothetical protein
LPVSRQGTDGGMGCIEKLVRLMEDVHVTWLQVEACFQKQKGCMKAVRLQPVVGVGRVAGVEECMGCTVAHGLMAHEFVQCCPLHLM